MQPLVTTAQAGVPKSAVATAVAWKLVEHVADLRRLLIDVHLPGIAEVFARQLRSRQKWRQRGDLEGAAGW